MALAYGKQVLHTHFPLRQTRSASPARKLFRDEITTLLTLGREHSLLKSVDAVCSSAHPATFRLDCSEKGLQNYRPHRSTRTVLNEQLSEASPSPFLPTNLSFLPYRFKPFSSEKMRTDNENLVVQILATVGRKTGTKMTFATTDIIKTELLEDGMHTAEIIVGMTVDEMDMHNLWELFSVDNHKLDLLFFCKDSK